MVCVFYGVITKQAHAHYHRVDLNCHTCTSQALHRVRGTSDTYMALSETSSSLRRVSRANPSRHPRAGPSRLQNRLSLVRQVRCSRFSTRDISENKRRTKRGRSAAYTKIPSKKTDTGFISNRRRTAPATSKKKKKRGHDRGCVRTVQ